MYISVSPVSPLRFNEDDTESIIAVAQSGTPLNPLPCPTLGATAPISLAGALAQQHAETLASLLIAAAANPGVSVTYCSRLSPIDLRSAVSCWGGPEIGMAGACATQLAHRLGLPCDNFGLTTSSTHLDPQFAYERFATVMLPALSGIDIMSGVGGTASVIASGLDIAVIDDEIISLLKYLLAGCRVNDETLALDVMKEVIPRDGVFLAEMHTVQQVRKGNVWTPPVSERTGATAVVPRARAKAKEILRTHQPKPLSDDVLRQLDEIMAQARRELIRG